MATARPLIVEPIGLEVDALARPIVWKDLFGSAHPVELEIGSGKGTFILEQARQRPEVNFIGIEWARKYWRLAADRLRRHGCLNVRMVRAEAGFFLRECCAAGSLAAVHIYFPDPWPKKRHHKRRLIQPPFIVEVHRVLAEGGRLQVVTDHLEYYEQIQQVLATSPLKPTEYQRPASAAGEEYVGTNFERKYRKEGRPFHAAAAIKVA